MKILFTPEAENDIEETTIYIADKNPKMASDIFDQIWYTCKLLINMPEMGVLAGSVIDDNEFSKEMLEVINANLILKKLRKFHVSGFKNLIIFYEVEDGNLKIVRVLHSSRDIPSLLSQADFS